MDRNLKLSFADYDEVFTPGAPIELPEFFFGREQQLKDLERALRRPGLHPVVIGNRGVGKTSLVHQSFLRDDLDHVGVTCDPQMSFDGLARAVLRGLHINADQTEETSETTKSVSAEATPFGVGAKTGGEEKHTETTRGLADRTLNPWDLFTALSGHPKVVLIIDEYDAVPITQNDFHQGVAALIKTLADNRTECDSRVLVVGVAQAARDLLAEHESIERSAREVYLRPLRYADVRDFLQEAETELGFTFAPGVREALVTNSLGYPYYVHLVGLECIDAMHDRNTAARTVEIGDYEVGVKRAVQKAFRSELRKYNQAIRGLNAKQMEMIRELVASRRGDRLPRLQMQRFLKQRGVANEKEFNDLLMSMQQETGLLYVSRNLDDVRFTDPLMAPFLKSWIFPIQERQRDLDQLPLFPSEERE